MKPLFTHIYINNTFKFSVTFLSVVGPYLIKAKFPKILVIVKLDILDNG